MQSFHNDSTDRLFKIISALDSAEDCYAFFEDLCTIKEIRDMAQRFDTAILLSDGQSYKTIAESVNVSTATISRVNRCLEYGSGGYRLALKKLEDSEKEAD